MTDEKELNEQHRHNTLQLWQALVLALYAPAARLPLTPLMFRHPAETLLALQALERDEAGFIRKELAALFPISPFINN